MAFGVVPNWAEEIIHRILNELPICGHYTFPRPVLRICEAIGAEKCPEFVCGCYTADSERKILMSYYVYCLDAWLKNAPLEIAAAELAMRDDLGRDWTQIIAAIYDALGAPSRQKVLLVRRLVHRLRWWIKTLVWSDDKRDRYMLDVYSGDVRGNTHWGTYGNPPFGDPWPVEVELPEMKELAEQIRETVPDGEGILIGIEETWLCAPKVFRYLEKLIVEIGTLRSGSTPSDQVSILQCEDTYPNTASYQKWYASFMSSLTAWLEGDREAVAELGDVTPVKHWLARIFRHKLRLYEKHTRFGQLIGAKPSGKRGTRAI